MLNTPHSFQLAELLAEQAAADGLKKSERTRLRLLQSTATLLDNTFYPQLRAADIAEHAGLSYGVMYHYFKDKSELTTQAVVLLTSEFGSRLQIPATIDGQSLDSYHRVFLANAYYIDCFARNRGLFRVMFTQEDELPGVKAALEELSYNWHRKVGLSMEAPAGRALKTDDRLLAGYMLGGMADEILRQIYLKNSPHLPQPESRDDLIKLCELLSLLWYRAAFAKDPAPDILKAAGKLLTKSLSS